VKLSDVRAIVTGAGSGMGRNFALNFARAGGKVLATDVNEAGLQGTTQEAEGAAGQVFTMKADVSQEGDVVAMIANAWELLGGCNVLVNNAGIFRDGLLLRTDKETGKVKGKMELGAWNQVLAVDLTGPFLCTREFAAACIDRGCKDAVVVNISSIARHGNMGQSNYSAAKAGLVADTKLWSLELAKFGIRTGAIAPGFVQTPILDGMKPEMLAKMVSAVPLGRTGQPDEIFAGVRFIVECGFFTGRCIDIDGGQVL
jgi:3-oxoacyl-[acyl-carrier protein] reductase